MTPVVILAVVVVGRGPRFGCGAGGATGRVGRARCPRGDGGARLGDVGLVAGP